MPAQTKVKRKFKSTRGWIGIKLYLVITLILTSTAAGTWSCSRLPDSTSPSLPVPGTPSTTPFQPISWTITPSPLPETPTPTAPPYSLWINPNIPKGLRDGIEIPAEIGSSPSAQDATFRLEIGGTSPISEWIYVLAAPFPTVTDGVSKEEIHQAWRGKSVKGFRGVPLLMDEATLNVLSELWGEPHKGAVEIALPENLAQKSWDQRPSWTIIPFEALNPKWKALSIDGVSPVHKDFDPARYPLTIPISLVGEGPIKPGIPNGNRNPEKLTTLLMTGVTALVRATANTMEQRGVTYPARDLGSLLRSADITHISNEVPFAKDCPYPNPFQTGMVFCSSGRYIELLDYVGTDIVELTGDHFSDWGKSAMNYTLELYDQRSWPYFGGGANLKDGRQAAVIKHNGNTIAFIGCNAKGPGYAHASSSNPGAVVCDFPWMIAEIQRLSREGYLTVATFQHFEYYTYAAQANQISDAQKLTKAGAVIVSGSQAHHPQGMEFSHGSFVHHGLGNLFFDQFDVSTGTRQGFIDRHVFYDGRHISTELITIWFEDYARARLMTQEEREQLLTVVFQASGW